MVSQNILLEGFDVSSAELCQTQPMIQLGIQPCLSGSCLCLSPMEFPEQLSLLWQCVGGKCFCSFSWEGCVFRLSDPPWFSDSQTLTGVVFIESGVFFSQKQVGAEWKLPGLVVWECCLSWAPVVSDFKDRLL